MATTYSNELAPTQASPPGVPSALAGYGARKRTFRATITYASQASGSTIVLIDQLPPGYIFAGGTFTTDTSTGSATIAIGTAGSTAAFKAAAAYTTTDVPLVFGKAAALAQDAPAAASQVVLTTGGAALPSSGTGVVELDFIAP
jgi:hypothetical protein